MELTGIIPWLERNRPTPSQATLDGLKNWLLQATGNVIITTTPGNAGLYGILRREIPLVKYRPIASGLKTHPILGTDFTSPDGWRQVRREVVEQLRVNKTRTVVFEHENAMRPFWTGEQDCDLDKLRTSIRNANFPQDVTYYWYPSVGAWRNSDQDPQQDRAAELCEIALECFNDLVLVDHASLSGPKSLTWGANVRVGGLLREVTSRQPVPVLYCYGPGSRWWQDEQLPEALGYALPDKLYNGAAILYTGATRWVEASETIPEILKNAGLIE